jgi:hypothetical protein
MVFNVWQLFYWFYWLYLLKLNVFNSYLSELHSLCLIKCVREFVGKVLLVGILACDQLELVCTI